MAGPPREGAIARFLLERWLRPTGWTEEGAMRLSAPRKTEAAPRARRGDRTSPLRAAGAQARRRRHRPRRSRTRPASAPAGRWGFTYRGKRRALDRDHADGSRDTQVLIVLESDGFDGQLERWTSRGLARARTRLDVAITISPAKRFAGACFCSRSSWPSPGWRRASPGQGRPPMRRHIERHAGLGARPARGARLSGGAGRRG